MLKRICNFEKKVDDLGYIWVVTIATIVGVGLAAWGAMLFTK
jgi:hypothetical protein